MDVELAYGFRFATFGFPQKRGSFQGNTYVEKTEKKAKITYTAEEKATYHAEQAKKKEAALKAKPRGTSDEQKKVAA